MAIDPQTVLGGMPEGAANGTDLTGLEPGTAPEAVDIWGRVGELDAEELMQRHPELKRRMDGRVGTLAEQRAQQLAQQQLGAREAQIRLQAREEAMRDAEEQRLRALRETDPFQYAEVSKQVEQSRQTRAAEEATRMAQQAPTIAALQAAMAYDRQVLDHLLNQLPEGPRQKLIAERGEVWGRSGDAYAARRAMIEDVMTLKADLDRKEWERTHQAQIARSAAAAVAERSDFLAEQNADGRVDTGSGFPTGAQLSLADWRRMSNTERMEHKKRDPDILTKIGMASRQGTG